MFRVLFIASFFLSSTAYSQSVPKLREIADEHYELNQFTDAIQFYRKITRLDKNDVRSKYRLASSYYKTLQYPEARQEFAKLTSDTSQYQHLSIYYYGTVLKLESDFSGADSVFAHLITSSNVDPGLLELTQKQKEGCVLALNQEEQNRGFSIQEMKNLNSKFHDFGAVVSRREKAVVFVTTRKLGGRQYEALQFDGLLPDLVQFTPRGNNWRNVSNRDRFDNLNTEWSEGSGSFTANDSAFYFTSCRSNDGSDCKIMKSEYRGGRWRQPEPLNEYINQPGTESKHPSITVSGDTLFFVSNREDGYGGDDIWMSVRGLEEEAWTPAINMGEFINTASNEITPYYSSAYNCLLFSSDGHVGYGGFDIFAAKGVSFFEPEIYNLGAPYNSALNDAYFSISDSIGFLSSNRKDLRHLNLYNFEVPNERLYLALLITGESLIDSRIVSRYRDIRSLDLTTFRVEDYQGFDLFEPAKRIKPKPTLLEELEAQTVDLIADSNPQRLSNDQNQSLSRLSNDLSLSSNLSNLSNDPSNNTRIRLVGTSTDGNTLERRLTTVNIVTDEMLATFDKADFEKVYFEFGGTGLSKQAQLSLDNLMNQIKRSIDDIQYIQIVASTDDVGSEQYNLDLSVKRGIAVRDYLINKGYSSEKLIVDAYGENNLITDGTSWYERFFDRRAELFVYSTRPLQLDKAKKFLVRENMSVNNASEILNVSQEKIKIWNEIPGSKLKKGDVIRVEGPIFTSNVRYFLDETDVKNKFFPYIVEEGETISSVARKFKTPEELLVEINQLETEVSPGDVVFVYNRKVAN